MPQTRNAAARLTGAMAILTSTWLTSTLLSAGAASAQSPLGVWIDHTGRGAVEITECNGGLCGHVVWVKDAKHGKTCRNQILGNVKPVGSNTWDRGWIVDPDDNSRYSVELKPIGSDRLRVVGYMGSKLFSETMTWRRAPADLQRCDGVEAQEAKAVPIPPPAPAQAPTPTPAPVAGPAQPQPAEVARQSQPDAAPATVVPPAAPKSAAAEPEPEAKPAPGRKVASTSTVESDPPPQKAKRKSSSRNCKLDLPYITINYPCDAF